MKLNYEQKDASSQFFILSLALLNIILSFDGYMYFAASEQIIEFFKITTPQIDNITKANYAGVLVGSFLLSKYINQYNKKYLLLLGMLSYVISKIICVLTTSFEFVVFCNFVAGIANSFPPAIIVLLLLQRYPDDKTTNTLLILDILTYGVSLTMPLLTAYLVEHYGWKVSFIFPSLLGIISFISTYYFIHDLDSNSKNSSEGISFKELISTYWKMLKNLKFVTFVLIASLPWITSNLRQVSVPILTDEFHISLIKFSFAKEILLVVNIIFAFLTIKLTERRGLDYTSNLGFIVLIAGVIFFGFASYIKIQFILFLATVISIAGENLAIGFSVRAISCLSKEYQGSASSFLVMANSLLIVRSTTLSQRFFNDTILTNAMLMLCYIIISIILYVIVMRKENKVN